MVYDLLMTVEYGLLIFRQGCLHLCSSETLVCNFLFVYVWCLWYQGIIGFNIRELLAL